MAGRSFLRRRVTPVIASALAGVLLVAGCISQAGLFQEEAASEQAAVAGSGSSAEASAAASLGHDPSLDGFPAVPDYSGDDYV